MLKDVSYTITNKPDDTHGCDMIRVYRTIYKPAFFSYIKQVTELVVLLPAWSENEFRSAIDVAHKIIDHDKLVRKFEYAKTHIEGPIRHLDNPFPKPK